MAQMTDVPLKKAESEVSKQTEPSGESTGVRCAHLTAGNTDSTHTLQPRGD